MSEEKANQDYRYPMAETFLYGPVTEGSFTTADRLPIFWGSGQLTTNYPSYSPPNTELWRHYEHLNIPRVTRFIFDNGDGDIPRNAYNDDSHPSPPTPPPFNCPGFQYEVGPLMCLMRTRRSTAPNPNNPFDTGGFNAAFTTPNVTFIKWFNTTIDSYVPLAHSEYEIRIYTGTPPFDDETVYQGPIKDCPRIITIPARYISWYQICEGGGIPEGGSRTLVATQLWTLKEKDTNPGRPPECDIALAERVNEPDFYQPLDYPFNILPMDYRFSEVPDVAKDWYGCNDDGGPRQPPTPSLPFPLPPPPP